MALLRRLAGATLLLAAFAPLHRLLDPVRTGPAGSATRAAAEAAWTIGLSGTLIVVTFSWVCARVVGHRPVFGDWGARAMGRLESISSRGFATAIGVTVTTLAGTVAFGVFGAAPTSVDEMAQLLHAQAVATGRLGVPLVGSGASWVIQNGIVTGAGWASIYPPAHTLLLALGVRLGAAWLVGPAVIGTTTAVIVLTCERLLGVAMARLVGLLLAVSPFWILIGATHLSHSSAALGLALVLWTGVRAWDGGAGRWLAVGASVGLAVCARPWIGLACSAAILLALWGPRAAEGSSPLRAWLRRLPAVAAGGLPFAGLLFWWNARLFGSPGRLGYEAAFGPAHGLGFGTDPWGNSYGPLEALAYTAADLNQLGVRLLESPLPLLAVLGAVLLLRPLRDGVGVFGAWAASAVAANSVYWHHGIHMGPRMLYESAPAWMALFVASAALVVGPAAQAGATPDRSTARSLARWSLGVTIAASLVLAPSVVRSAGQSAWRPPPLSPPTAEALIFVHGSWSSRIASRLAASGMRRDSIETALRRNDVCGVDGYARWRTSPDGAAVGPPLDFEPLAGSPSVLEARTLSPGNIVRVSPGRELNPTCLREARADRLGVLELELLAWRYPAMPGAAIAVARDLGPAGNIALLQVFSRPTYLYVEMGAPNGPVLFDYSQGMELLWGGAAGSEGGPIQRLPSSPR